MATFSLSSFFNMLVLCKVCHSHVVRGSLEGKNSSGKDSFPSSVGREGATFCLALLPTNSQLWHLLLPVQCRVEAAGFCKVETSSLPLCRLWLLSASHRDALGLVWPICFCVLEPAFSGLKMQVLFHETLCWNKILLATRLHTVTMIF